MIEQLEPLVDAFKIDDRYEAHAKGGRILRELARDNKFLFSVFRQNFRNPEFLGRDRHHPIIAVPIFENEDFSLVCHLWFPLPTLEVDVTHQTIHHHGKLLLTSVSPFGSGYESILFKKGFEIDFGSLETKMEIDRIYQHELYNLEFVDAQTPHVVFFPKEFSITYAMWSKSEKHQTDRLKRAPLIKKFKKPLSMVMKKIGLSKYLALNSAEYFDFYPCEGKLLVLKERNFGYRPGDNANFVQNMCSALSQIAFDDEASLLALKDQFKEMNHPVGTTCVDQLLRGEKVPEAFVSHQMNIPQVNVKKSEILGVFS